MLTPESNDDCYNRLINVFSALKRRQTLKSDAFFARDGHEVALSVREAVFSPFETLPIEKAVGRIAAAPTVSCPPAVPIVVSGEVIRAEDKEIFSYYGITEVDVVK